MTAPLNQETTKRVSATPAALALIEKLTTQFGPIIFLQSGGCCEGSGPLCMPVDEFRASAAGVAETRFVIS